MNLLKEQKESARELLKTMKKEVQLMKQNGNLMHIKSINEKLKKLEILLAGISDEDSNLKAIDQLTKAYNKLGNKNKNLQKQIDHTNLRIWSVNNKLQVTTINNNFVADFKKAFGVTLKEGISVLISLPEPLKSTWTDRYERALKGKQFTTIDEFSIKGVPQFIETSFTPIYSNKEVVGISCYSHDITMQKSTELQFQDLLDFSPNPITIVGEDGYKFVNKAWEEVSGYSREESLKWGIEKIVPLVEGITIEQTRAYIKRGEGNTRRVVKLKAKNKKIVFLDTTTTHIIYENTPVILSIGSDITELLELQKDLKKSRAKLKTVLETTELRIWSIDTNMNMVTFNKNYKDDYKVAFGVELKEGNYSLEGLSTEDHKVWVQRYKRALSGEALSFIEHFQYEGISTLYSEIKLTPIYEDSNIIGAACYAQDVSKRITAELALKESERRFKTLVANIPSVTYRCKMDEHWTMLFISDEIKNLSGYPGTDFIDNKVRPFSSIIHKDDNQMVNQAVEQGVKDNSGYKIEYRIIHRTGTVKWVNERGKGIFDDTGNLLWLDGVITDITQRKMAEAALKESEEQYRAIFNSMSDVYFRANLEGNIIIVSPSVIDFFGYTPDEVTGTSFDRLLSSVSEGKELFQKIKDEGFVRDYENTFTTKNKDEKLAATNAKLIVNNNSKPIGIEGVIRDITLSRMAQQALEERNREMDSIFENTPTILLLIDEDGHVLNVNKSGFAADEIKPRYTSLLAGEAVKCVNTIRTKTDCGKGLQCEKCIIRNIVINTLKTKENQKQVEGTINILINEQKLERNFLISTAFIPFEHGDRVLISIDDITEMRNAEEEIRRLSIAVDQSTATVVITDIEGRIEYVNPQFEKTTGYKADEVIGKNPRFLKANKNPRNLYSDLWKTILSGQTWQGEFLNKRKDGFEYWESANISPISDREGNITHFIAIKENITEKKRIQEELIRSESELREMNEQKTRYLSILAHDLRGLVGSFHAYSNLIQTHFDEFTEDDLREQIELLTKASGDSLSLLDNLLAWGKSTSGRMVLEIQDTNLHKQVELVLKVLSEVAGKKKIRLVNNTNKDTIIATDYNVLQTIIRNLVNNAIKFTPEEGTITIDAKENNEGLIEVSVIDTGIGMNEKMQKQVFNLGEKSIREGTNQEQGTGLGLSICRELVRKLGGTIHVESKEGNGARFYFIVPVKQNTNKTS